MKHKTKNKNRSAGHSQNRKQNNQRPPRIKANIFGKHAVIEAWKNPNRRINALYITENTLNDFQVVLNEIAQDNLNRPSPQIISRDALNHAVGDGQVHQGIALDAAPIPEIDLGDIIRLEENKEHSHLIMLDQVTDPHNVGAIIRSASAFGAAGLIMQKKHAPELTGVLAKIACGGVEHLNIAFETNLTRALETLQDAGYFAIGLDERGKQTLAETPNYQKSIIVLGAEGSGLRRLIREQCDILAKLPTTPPIMSLNVSNAAAVALYDLSIKSA